MAKKKHDDSEDLRQFEGEGQKDAESHTDAMDRGLPQESDEPELEEKEVPLHYRDFALGDTVIGNGAECLEQDKEYEVKQDEQGRLYLDCNEGKHYLDRCVDEHDNIWGIKVKRTMPVEKATA